MADGFREVRRQLNSGSSNMVAGVVLGGVVFVGAALGLLREIALIFLNDEPQPILVAELGERRSDGGGFGLGRKWFDVEGLTVFFDLAEAEKSAFGSISNYFVPATTRSDSEYPDTLIRISDRSLIKAMDNRPNDVGLLPYLHSLEHFIEGRPIPLWELSRADLSMMDVPKPLRRDWDSGYGLLFDYRPERKIGLLIILGILVMGFGIYFWVSICRLLRGDNRASGAAGM
ncbi:MAG: hypothetical protein AAGD22_14000 [Verrucomicrobiota bacterium]